MTFDLSQLPQHLTFARLCAAAPMASSSSLFFPVAPGEGERLDRSKVGARRPEPRVRLANCRVQTTSREVSVATEAV